MGRWVCGVVAAAGLAGFTGAPPAFAPSGHGSCGEGTRSFIMPQAHSGAGGAIASALAREGILDEQVAAGHAALCEPRP